MDVFTIQRTHRWNVQRGVQQEFHSKLYKNAYIERTFGKFKDRYSTNEVTMEHNGFEKCGWVII
jgi:hypothetical protein